MKFDSLEALIRHVVTNNIDVSTVEFAFPEESEASDPTVTPDIVVEPSGEGSVKESITIHLPSGDLVLDTADPNVIVVESYDLIPNTCGAGSIVVDGRVLHLDMCESDDGVVAHLDVTVGGKRSAYHPMVVKVEKR